jgi:hypothetical protein
MSPQVRAHACVTRESEPQTVETLRARLEDRRRVKRGCEAELGRAPRFLRAYRSLLKGMRGLVADCDREIGDLERRLAGRETKPAGPLRDKEQGQPAEPPTADN